MNDLLIELLVLFAAMVITSVTFIGIFEFIFYVLNKRTKVRYVKP